jgi:N-glycosylase/DNA lyase
MASEKTKLNKGNSILQSVKILIKSNLSKKVKVRIREFERAGRKDTFNELCFCLLTANYSAERAIEIQKKIGDGFCTLSEKALAKKLKELGYRFPNARAKYIVGARAHIPYLKKITLDDDFKAREYLAKNVKGLGYKEASHYLRNIGRKNLAIIDFHIIDLLAENKIIEKPKNLSSKRYMEIEEKLAKLCKKLNLSQAELDLYLWYLETGKILK